MFLTKLPEVWECVWKNGVVAGHFQFQSTLNRSLLEILIVIQDCQLRLREIHWFALLIVSIACSFRDISVLCLEIPTIPSLIMNGKYCSSAGQDATHMKPPIVQCSTCANLLMGLALIHSMTYSSKL